MNLYCFELRIRAVSKGGLRYVHRACFFWASSLKIRILNGSWIKSGVGARRRVYFHGGRIDDLSLAMGVFINNLVTILRDIRPSSFFSCRGGVRVSRFFPVRRSAAVVRDALHTRQWESHTHRRESCGDDLIWSTREKGRSWYYRACFFQASSLKIFMDSKYTLTGDTAKEFVFVFASQLHQFLHR